MFFFKFEQQKFHFYLLFSSFPHANHHALLTQQYQFIFGQINRYNFLFVTVLLIFLMPFIPSQFFFLEFRDIFFFFFDKKSRNKRNNDTFAKLIKSNIKYFFL